MIFSSKYQGQEEALISLFRATFTAAEGPEEGAQIAAFVRALLDTTPADDLFVFTAAKYGRVIGAIAFSRLRFEDDAQQLQIGRAHV